MADASIKRTMNLFARSGGMAEGVRKWIGGTGGEEALAKTKSRAYWLVEELERAVWEALRLWDPEMALPVCPLTGQVYLDGEWIDVVAFLRKRIAKPLVGKLSDQALLDLVERELGLYHQHILVG